MELYEGGHYSQKWIRFLNVLRSCAPTGSFTSAMSCHISQQLSLKAASHKDCVLLAVA